jgi:hypothetical protein
MTDGGTTGVQPARAEREETFESRYEAGPAIALVMLLELTVGLTSRAMDWSLWVLPWWTWLAGIGPQAILLFPLVVDRLRHRLEERGHRRAAGLLLFGVVTLVNTLLLLGVLASLITGRERSGSQLLLEALIVWATNTITFGLWFWALDAGGPARRLESNPPRPDFQFPQLADPQVCGPGWYPRLFDYMYVSFTNSIAFSPTDTMPLTQPAKALMLAESAVSAVTVLLVAARAVNIFT